nr:G-protein-signaling modulator 2-like [Styela clava]
MMNMLANSQSKRMDEQRVSLSGLPGLRVNDGINGEGVINLQQPDGAAAPLPVVLRPRLENGGIPGNENRHSLDDTFFNALMRCQSTRLNDQRSSPPIFDAPVLPTPTIPDEDFFALIVRMQSSRIEDQRCRFSPERESPPNVDPDNDDISQ